MPSELGLAGPELPRQGERPEPPGDFGVVCRPVRTASERAAHVAIRHRIFVEEQAVFDETDLDDHDRDRTTIALLGFCDWVAAGTVRLFVLDHASGLWQGDRLAVLAGYRTRGVGAPLVRCAVATAAAAGGHSMTAHIQPANVTFFRHLGWTVAGSAETYAGLAHQPMSIRLPGRDEGVATVRSLAAGLTARGR